MNKICNIFIVLSIVFMLVAGISCAQSAPATKPAPVAPPKTGGTLNFGGVFMDFAPDPILTRNTAKPFMELIFDPLVGKTASGTDLSTATGIAEKWEVSPDVKTHTFYLRKGVKFHDGTELTAKDVKFSIDRVVGPESVSGYAPPLRDYISKVEVVDPYKVVVTTKVPAPDFEFYLSSVMGTEGSIVPKDYIESKGKGNFVKFPIGTGPYKVKEIVMGDHMTLEAVDQHWRIGVPRYKTIVLKHVTEEATLIAQLKRGETDIIEVSRQRAPEVEKAGYRKFVKPNAVGLYMHFYEMWDKDSPVADVRVRLALEMAVNKQEIADTLFQKQAIPWYAPTLTPPDPCYDEKLFKPHLYDPVKAKQLIAEVGGTPQINFYSYPRAGVPELASLVEAVAGYWEKIGVKTKIIPMDYDTFRSNMWLKGVKDGKPAGGGGGAGVVSIHSLPSRLWYFATDYKDIHSKSQQAMIKSPEVDKLLDAVEAESTWEGKVKLAKEWHKYKHDNNLRFAFITTGLIYAANDKITKWEFPSDEYSMGWDSLISSK